MGLLRFLSCLVISSIRVAIRRRREGPLLPSWPFGFEVIIAAQKRFNASVTPLPPERQRALWGALRARSAALTRGAIEERPIGAVPAWWFRPPDAADGPLILYLHGGSFIYGSEASHGDLAARIALASSGEIVLPMYRLAPEHPFPAAADDAFEAYRALIEYAGNRPIVVAGDSAGGNLALALLLRLRDAGLPLPRAAVPISPWVDLNARGGSLERNATYDWAEPEHFERWANTYLANGEDRRRPDVSPAHADLRGLPPVLVVVGEAEMLFDQVTSWIAKARHAGVEVEQYIGKDMVHLWMTHAAMFPFCQDVIDSIGAYVRRHCERREGPYDEPSKPKPTRPPVLESPAGDT